MPELPEVEITARGLRERIVGKRVAGVCGVDWPRMLPNTTEEELHAVLVGRAVAAVDRRGKYLLASFSGGVALCVHRKMSGNLLLRDSLAPPEPHTHLVIAFTNQTELRFVDARKFGRIHLFHAPAELEAFLDARLGPEPLPDLDGTTLARLVQGRRARIKSLLLDQAFLAGVGNLYADEALWEARIHPLRPASTLTRPEIARLASAIRHVLEQAIQRRGTSFSSYLDAEGLAGQNQDYLNAYGRGPTRTQPAQPCPRCDTPIQRLILAQRSSHFCPRCQKQGRR